MSDLREALKEAILQINYLHGRLGAETGSGNATLAKLRAALAQPEAVEPVAYVPLSKAEVDEGQPIWRETRSHGSVNPWVGYECINLYTTPPVAPNEQPEAVDPERTVDLMASTISCSGTDITIACNNLDVRDTLFDWLTGIPPIAPDERMRRALERCRSAISHLGEYILGGVSVDRTDGSGPSYQYPIRDELLAEIDEALSRADEGKESEGGPDRNCSETSRSNCEPERSPSDPTPQDAPGLNWELSDECKKHLAEIDRCIVRPGDPRLNQIIGGSQPIPVQDAESVSGAHVTDRTGGANPPTGSTPQDATAQREAIARAADSITAEVMRRRDQIVLESDGEKRRPMMISAADYVRDTILALQTRAGG